MADQPRSGSTLATRVATNAFGVNRFRRKHREYTVLSYRVSDTNNDGAAMCKQLYNLYSPGVGTLERTVPRQKMNGRDRVTRTSVLILEREGEARCQKQEPC